MKDKIFLPRYKMGLSVETMDKFFLEDIHAHQRRQQYSFNDIRRKVAKAKTFPVPYLFKFSRGKEEYRAYTNIYNKNQMYKDGIDFDSVVFFNNSRGRCAYTNRDPFDTADKKELFFSSNGIHQSSHRYLFTPHFFERYEMRHGWDDGFSDIYNQFFFNNATEFYTQMCNARAEDYKTIDVWSLCNDGLMLGEVKSEEDFNNGKPYIIQINTFLDINTLSKRQDKYANILQSLKAAFDGTSFLESEADTMKRTFVLKVKQL